MKFGYIAPSLPMAGLLAALIAVVGPVATASDEFAGALIGAGAGAALGHAMGGHDGAVVGGFLGAVVGASAVDHDYRGGVYYRSRPYEPYVIYGPPPVRYYAPPPYWTGPRYVYPHWRYDRDGRYDGPWHHDRGGWRDGRHDRDRDDWRDGRHDRDRDGWRDGRGPR